MKRSGLAFDLASSRRFATARTLIHGYYAIIFYFAVGNLHMWQGYLATTEVTPRWPVFWLRYVDTHIGIGIVLWLHLIGGLIGILAPGYRWVRIVVVVSLLEFLSFKYSFGAVNHGDHLSILIGFVLVWLPVGWSFGSTPGRRVRTETLLVFSGCQAMILLTYSMAGMWKLGGVLYQTVKGEVHALSPQGLSQQVAAKLLEDDGTSVLGPWLIDHPVIAWPLMVLTLYLQLFALRIVDRPALHLAWGLGLILFHISSALLMGVGFANNTLWLALFMVLSPFRPDVLSIREALSELPLVGRFVPGLEGASPGQERRPHGGF